VVIDTGKRVSVVCCAASRVNTRTVATKAASTIVALKPRPHGVALLRDGQKLHCSTQ
jgi:hypothetical protein